MNNITYDLLDKYIPEKGIIEIIKKYRIFLEHLKRTERVRKHIKTIIYKIFENKGIICNTSYSYILKPWEPIREIQTLLTRRGNITLEPSSFTSYRDINIFRIY